MATHDYVIDNSTGANVRADLNLVLQAILSNNSSGTAPSTTAAYMWWADTSAGILKIRNSADNAWVELLQLDGTLTLEDGSASTPALAFRDDLDTGIFSSAANNINFATGGVERLELSGSSTIFNESGADINFRVEGDTNVNLLFVDAGEDRIGVNENAPLGKFHIKSTDASVSAVNSSVNELVLENNGSCGMSIFSSTSNQGAIAFGDSDDNDVGKIVYDHSDNSIFFKTAANERMRIDSSGNVMIGTTTEGNGGADDLTVANSGTGGITIRSGTSNDGNLWFSDGTSGDAEYRGYIQYEHSNDAFNFGTAAATRVKIDSAGQVGIGCTPTTQLEVEDTADSRITITAGNGISQSGINFKDNTGVDGIVTYDHNDRKLHLGAGTSSFTDGDITIDSTGKVLIGTTTGVSNYLTLGAGHYTVASSGQAVNGLHIKGTAGNAGEFSGGISFATGGSGASAIAGVQTASDTDHNGLAFFNHQSTAGSDNAVEIMRLGANIASLYLGCTTNEVTIASSDASFSQGCGVTLCGGDGTGHYNIFVANDTTTMYIGRQTTDGDLVDFRQAGSKEGSISVSGSTVSYNGGHLSRYSQLSGISSIDKSARPEIYQGTVMSNLDELCSWSHPDVLYTEQEKLDGKIPDGKDVGDIKTAAYTEDNQQLNITKISDVDGDKDVAGVFWTWDDDDDEIVNDFYVAMTGDMVIRVAASTTVARGDLLISAGDGTAKPQADDIIRSSTIAKIISTNHTATYADGSKAYPCVLMAC